MNDNIELLRGVMIVSAVIGSYEIARLEGGVAAGMKRIRIASLLVGFNVLAVSVVACTLGAAAGTLNIAGADLFVCIISVSVGTFFIYLLLKGLQREKYVPLVFFYSILLSVVLLVGEEGSVVRLLARGAVYGGYFISALLLFSRIRYRTDESESCECFRGLPVNLLSGAFLSCALHGILKVWEKLFT